MGTKKNTNKRLKIKIMTRNYRYYSDTSSFVCYSNDTENEHNEASTFVKCVCVCVRCLTETQQFSHCKHNGPIIVASVSLCLRGQFCLRFSFPVLFLPFGSGTVFPHNPLKLSFKGSFSP